MTSRIKAWAVMRDGEIHLVSMTRKYARWLVQDERQIDERPDGRPVKWSVLPCTVTITRKK